MKDFIQCLTISIKYRYSILQYYLFYPFLHLFWKFPKANTIDETLDELIEKKISIARFGDGELDIIWNRMEGFQKADYKLGLRLSEILNSYPHNILIGIADFYHDYTNYRINQLRFIKRFRIKNLINILKTFKRKEFANAYISRPVSMYDDIDVENIFNKFKLLWKDKNLYVIEGDKCRCGVGNDLFDGCLSVKRIICPSVNSFDRYDEILDVCQKLIPKESVIYMALGPTATILAYDLGRLGYQALDLGHLDIEYEYMKRGVFNGKRIVIPGKYVNEAVGGDIVDDSIIDEKYINSIIYTI